MAKVFSSYTNVVRKMVRNYNVELYNYFSEQNIEESWVDHDNWNGGIDFYMIIIRVPVDYFENIRRRGVVEEIENTIGSFYNDAMRGDGESIQLRGVILKPIADDISVFGDNVDDSMWKPGHFRLFISHLSANKESASNLKRCLLDYGIDCFVAHEDITPSKEWEMEIEKALFTMDALCAIVVPDFIKSLWCDQEVGIALGQRKLVISIDKGNVPYGFFGKYQALKSRNKTANELASDVWKALYTNERSKVVYFNKLVSLILNSTVKSDAVKYIEIIKKCEDLGKYFVESLHNNLSANIILNSEDVIDSINPLFQKYGLMPLSAISHSDPKNDYNDLPF